MRQLIFRQKLLKILDDYPVKDEHGHVAYRVRQAFNLIRGEYNVYDANGDLVFNLKQKLLHLFRTYQMTFVDGEEVILKEKIGLLRRKLKIESADYNLEIKGNIWDYNYEIKADHQCVGKVSRKLLSFHDHFVLDIYDERYEAVILALAIVVDAMVDQDAAAASSASV